MVKVDPKYVAMLNKAYEKYSKLEIVNSNFEHLSDSYEFQNKCIGESEETKNSCNIENKSKIKNENEKSLSKFGSCKSKKIRKNKANYGLKRYSEEENEFILKYLENNTGLNQAAKIRELEKLMGRTYHSIKYQLKVLRSGPIVPARKRKIYSLTEDKFIIDEAIKHLKDCKSLREAKIQNLLDFSKFLKRSHKTINERWESSIKCWLLQYYNKNLNQEIRPMLVDLIHKNFDSIVDINWEFVSCHQEFSGYNISGLKKLFFAMIDKVSKYLSKPSYEVSLNEIAKFTEEYFNRQRRTQSFREKRKIDCVEYFELKTSEQNISFSKR